MGNDNAARFLAESRKYERERPVEESGRGIFLQHRNNQQSVVITRKARIWPEIPKETVALPPPPNPPNAPMPTMLITSLFSIIGIITIEVVISRGGNSGFNSLPFVALSGIMGLSSGLSFFVQLIVARRRASHLLKAYQQRLQEIEKQLQALQWKERQACIDLHPPFVLPSPPLQAYEQLQILPLIQRTLNNQDVGLWARRPIDPDFLTARIGMGRRQATFKIRSASLENYIAIPSKLDAYKEYARGLVEQYESLVAPFTVKLDTSSPVTIVGSWQRLTRARELMHAIVSQLVYHHSPEDLRIIVLAPQSQQMVWQWAGIIPHTVIYDPRQSNENEDEGNETHAVAVGTEAVLDQLPLISRELSRRELLLGDARQVNKTALLPHLVIVVDHFDTVHDLDQPTFALPAVTPGQNAPVRYRSSLSVSPLKRPELTLALSRNILLGVSVLCVCADPADVPTTSGVMIDLDAMATPQGMATLPTSSGGQALIRTLQPDPPPSQVCDVLDSTPLEALRGFALRIQPLHAVGTKRLELRTQVDLRILFEPALDLTLYKPQERWRDSSFRMSHPVHGEVPRMRVPIGLKIGDEVQYLDLIKDGPHGLLIGQTGSGKSELLQTIITSLAVAYRPTEVNFLLIDYKAGLALEPFRRLPHTVGFLSNASSPALIQRFITMLKAEAIRREVRIKTEKTMPRLIIIIDEFAEMAKRTESVLEELFTITRVGREIGMHLLLAAQRPEGIIGSKVRDYVQYRLCLRCASPEDSREVLRRVDAANLPASIPGRGYLLHGDNQLDMFQAARVAVTLIKDQKGQFHAHSFSSFLTPATPKISTVAEAIIEKIGEAYLQEDAKRDGIIFWPDPLPTPATDQSPDPLTLFSAEDDYNAAFEVSPTSSMYREEKEKPLALVPLTIDEALSLRSMHKDKPSMQIPFGLIDKPELQQREIFLVDLHGAAGALTGGPLLIAGAQHSGKATALETMLLWLTTRFTPQQFRCAIIDPLQELDVFQDLPHLQLSDGASLWTDGSTDEKISKLVAQVTSIITKRRDDRSVQRWDERTLYELWEQGIEVPQLLIVISHFHSFADRMNAVAALKKLALSAMEARAQGIYLVITSAEIGTRYLPADLMGKFSTKVGLFLNEHQRFDLFGRTPVVPEPLPGRGLALTPDRSIHQVQLALPVPGATESQRREILKQLVLLLRDIQ